MRYSAYVCAGIYLHNHNSRAPFQNHCADSGILSRQTMPIRVVFLSECVMAALPQSSELLIPEQFALVQHHRRFRCVRAY